MRLPLTLFVAALALARPALAEDGAEGMGFGLGVYHGSGGVTVVNPSFRGDAEFDARTRLAVRLDADAVSAASFDQARSKTHRGSRPVGSCWTCHPASDALSGATRDYLEMRRGEQVSVTRIQGPVDLSLSYLGNQENDYNSNGASVGALWNAEDANTTVGLTLQALFDRIQPVTRAFSDELQTLGADLAVMRILTPRSFLRAGWSYAQSQGYLGAPYTFVQVADLADFPVRTASPRERSRHTGSLSYKQGLWQGSAGELGYRYYQDSWAVRSHTASLTLSQALAGWVLEPSLRFEAQPQGAYFFSNHYQAPQDYMTRDLKLAPHQSLSYGLGLRGSLGGWTLEARYLRYQRTDDLDYSLYFSDGPERGDLYQIAVRVP